MSMRRISSSFSSCLDSIEAVFEKDYSDDGEEFLRDGGRVGAIFLGGNHLGDKGVARIVNGLEDPCREYYKLYLCDNRIGRLGALKISYSLKLNTTLMELSLGNNHIGNEGARHLASSLNENSTLEMLNLENNNIGPVGTTALANALERNNSSLQWLVLSENPIGDEGVKSILRCIGNTSSFDHLKRCNHSLFSIILKKVTQVQDNTTLRKIPCFLKINRLSAPSSRLAEQRKIFLHVKENPHALLDYFTAIRGDDSMTELSLYPMILTLLGDQYDLSTTFVLLQNSPHLFSNDSDIEKVKQQQRIETQHPTLSSYNFVAKIDMKAKIQKAKLSKDAGGNNSESGTSGTWKSSATTPSIQLKNHSSRSRAVVQKSAPSVGKENGNGGEDATYHNHSSNDIGSSHTISEDFDDFLKFLQVELLRQQPPSSRVYQQSQQKEQSKTEQRDYSCADQSGCSSLEALSCAGTVSQDMDTEDQIFLKK